MTGPQIATLALGALLAAPIILAPVMREQPVRCETWRDIVTGGEHRAARFATIETCRKGAFVVSHRIIEDEETQPRVPVSSGVRQRSSVAGTVAP